MAMQWWPCSSMLEYVKMLSFVCEHRGMQEAWGFFVAMTKSSWLIGPTLMSLWQAILVIPTSIIVCERGFSTQNWVKIKNRTRLNLDTLDALMKVSLNGFGVVFMNWKGIFEYWTTTTRTNKHRALSLQEMELDGWCLILHIALETCTIYFMHKFSMSFVFHYYILGLASWIWANPSKWNSNEGFNLEHRCGPS